MHVIPYNIFRIKVSDPLGNFNGPSEASFGKELADIVAGRNLNHPWGGAAETTRRRQGHGRGR